MPISTAHLEGSHAIGQSVQRWTRSRKSNPDSGLSLRSSELMPRYFDSSRIRPAVRSRSSIDSGRICRRRRSNRSPKRFRMRFELSNGKNLEREKRRKERMELGCSYWVDGSTSWRLSENAG